MGKNEYGASGGNTSIHCQKVIWKYWLNRVQAVYINDVFALDVVKRYGDFGLECLSIFAVKVIIANNFPEASSP